MKVALLFVCVVSALLLIAVVLLQQGKGADMGSGFGRGASGGMHGAPSGANFMTRTTAALAMVFFVSTLALSMLEARAPRDDLLQNLAEENAAATDEDAAIDLKAAGEESRAIPD